MFFAVHSSFLLCAIAVVAVAFVCGLLIFAFFLVLIFRMDCLRCVCGVATTEENCVEFLAFRLSWPLSIFFYTCVSDEHITSM